MSNWRSESAYLTRYAGSGALNTIAGFSIIFLLMALGVSPFLANTGGYLFGLILGFFVSKKLVFRSKGHITAEGLRYLAAFLACFVVNLFVLQFALNVLRWNAIPAQLLAAAIYTAIMYLLTRFLVFRTGINSSQLNNGHGKYVAPDNAKGQEGISPCCGNSQTHHARPLSPTSDVTTSQPTKQPKDGCQVGGYPPAGESDDVSLREFHVKMD